MEIKRVYICKHKMILVVPLLPALEMKYGGSSPSAVPIPHKMASSWTWGNMLPSGTLEPCSNGNSGGPYSEQFLFSHEGPLFSWIVSYKALFRSTRPHCTAFIVKKAMCGPKYSTNVCKPDPVRNTINSESHWKKSRCINDFIKNKQQLI